MSKKCHYCDNTSTKTLVWLKDKAGLPARIRLPWCGCDLTTALRRFWSNPYQVVEGVDYVIEKPKAKLTRLFRDTPQTPEGKYLVKRRDGTVPPWPSFVLGGADPHAAVALRAYADSCATDPEIDPGFVSAVRRLADTYDRWRAEHGNGDPGMGRHRVDDPATIAEMRKGFSA